MGQCPLPFIWSASKDRRKGDCPPFVSVEKEKDGTVRRYPSASRTRPSAITISTRLFLRRPSAEELSAIGRSRP